MLISSATDSSKDILEELLVTGVISRDQFQIARMKSEKLLDNYPALVGSNPMVIAFASIYTTYRKNLDEITDLFILHDQRLGRNTRDKRWYHQTFVRAILRADLKPIN